jgi:hypothetical protein
LTTAPATVGGHEGNALRHSAHVGHSVKIAMIEAPRQSISPDGTGGFMTEQEKAFEEWWSKTYHPWTVVQCARDGFLAGYAAGECAARQQFTPLYHAVNELMAYMGAYGSAEARGDRAQAVMDALHAIDGGQYQTAKEPTPRDKGE